MRKFFSSIMIIISVLNICNSIVYGVEKDEYEYVKGIHNLLILGVNNEDNMRLNSTMILTIDGISKELKIATIDINDFIKQEDSYVKVIDLYEHNKEGYFEEKLEKAFNININSHVVIDKIAIERIVEVIDGITINNNTIDSNKVGGLFIIDDLNNPNSQREVIQGIINKLSILNFTEYPQIIFKTYDYVILNMNLYDMMSLAFTVLSFDSYDAIEYNIK